MVHKCPCCQSPLMYQNVRYDKSFACPSCDELLIVPRAHVQAHFWGTFIVCGLGLYLFGLRGYTLLLATGAVWLPALLLDMFLVWRLFPAPIRAYRGEDQNPTLNLRL
jgi:hypothetical protein